LSRYRKSEVVLHIDVNGVNQELGDYFLVADGSQRIGLESSFLAFGIKLYVLDFSTSQEDALAGKPDGGTCPPRPSGVAPQLGIAEAQVNL
jgi:hypothetical protein